MFKRSFFYLDIAGWGLENKNLHSLRKRARDRHKERRSFLCVLVPALANRIRVENK